MSSSRLLGIVAVVTAVCLVPTAASAVTTGHTGSGRPALAFAGNGNRLYVAWAGSSGTAAAKELVVGYSTSKGQRITKVPNTDRVPSGAGAALSSDGAGVYLAWPSGSAGNTLVAAYTTGSGLTCRTAFTGVVTTHAPALAADTAGTRWLAWTDPAAHLNLARLDSSACATGGAMRLAGRVTLPDTSVAGPALVYDDSGSSNLGFVLAYASGDAARTVKIGSFDGSATLTHRAQVAAPVGSADAPGLSSGNSDLYLSFLGTDGNVYLAYSEGCLTPCFDQHVSLTGEQATAGIGLPSSDFGLFRSFFDPTGHLVILSL
jgi:hypothetical protein